MNTPEVSIEEQSLAFAALKRGEWQSVQVLFAKECDWVDVASQSVFGNLNLDRVSIRRKPTPSPRPWAQAEFPLNAWFRRKGRPGTWFRCDEIALAPGDVKASIDGCWFTAIGMQQGLEWSADGREWANCEVVG